MKSNIEHLKHAKYSRILSFLTFNFIFFTFLFISLTIFTNPNKGIGNILVWINIYLLLSIIFFILNGVLYKYAGGDIAKVLSGISVRNGDGSYLSIRDYLFRELIGKFFSTVYLNLGFLYIFFNNKSQGFHDLLTESYVYINGYIRVVTSFFISFILLALSSVFFFNYLESNKIIDKMSIHANTIEKERNNFTDPNTLKLNNK